MPKQKKRKKSGGKRPGKRMRGASMSDALLMVLGGLVGGIGLTYATQKVTFLQGKIMGIVEAAVGAVLVWKMSHPLVKGLGIGMAITGGTNAARGFGLITGIGAPRTFRQSPMINGFREVPKIGGNSNIPGRQFPSPNVVGRSYNTRNYAGVYS